MEDAWKRKKSLPYTEMPLNTNISGMYMDDGRESMKKKSELMKTRASISEEKNTNKKKRLGRRT